MGLLTVAKTLWERITHDNCNFRFWLLLIQFLLKNENSHSGLFLHSFRFSETGIKAKQRVCIYHGSVADLCSPLHKEVENWDASASSEQSHDCLNCGMEKYSFFFSLLDRKRVYNPIIILVQLISECITKPTELTGFCE